MAEEGGGRRLAQVIAVEQRGMERPFVSLDDLERLAAEDATSLPRGPRSTADAVRWLGGSDGRRVRPQGLALRCLGPTTNSRARERSLRG
jgi:hypothetical protein